MQRVNTDRTVTLIMFTMVTFLSSNAPRLSDDWMKGKGRCRQSRAANVSCGIVSRGPAVYRPPSGGMNVPIASGVQRAS